MSVYDWVDEFAQEAKRQGDKDRMRLVRLFKDANKYIYKKPEKALPLLEEGRALAERLGEQRWVLLYDHWRANSMDDSQVELDIVVPAAVEAQKPEHKDFPQRICLVEDMLNAYLAIDARGHADEIQEGLEYMGSQVTPQVECYFCYLGLSTHFEYEKGHFDKAQSTALQVLADLDRGTYSSSWRYHYSISAYFWLCRIANEQQDDVALQRWAKEGEEVAWLINKWRMAQFLAWQALVALRKGDHKLAKRLYRKAVSKAKSAGKTQNEPYYDALCAYHELLGQYDRALKLRDQELAETVGRSNFVKECRCRIERCRLIAIMGQPLEEELAKAREVAQQLRKPEHILAKLAQIEQDIPHYLHWGHLTIRDSEETAEPKGIKTRLGSLMISIFN